MLILHELTLSQFFDDSRQICVLRVPYGAAILKLVLGLAWFPRPNSGSYKAFNGMGVARGWSEK